MRKMHVLHGSGPYNKSIMYTSGSSTNLILATARIGREKRVFLWGDNLGSKSGV